MSAPNLVIGALGNVGAEVVKHVLAQGGTVRATGSDVRKLKERFGDSVESIFRLILQTPLLTTATFQGVKRVLTCTRRT